MVGTPTFAAFCIGFVWPFLQGIYLSFCNFNTPKDADWVGVRNDIKDMTFDNYPFLLAAGYSLMITVVSVLLILVFCAMSAWYIARINSLQVSAEGLLVGHAVILAFVPSILPVFPTSNMVLVLSVTTMYCGLFPRK